MVGDGVVGVAVRGRRVEHRLEGRDAVGEVRVRVEVAAEVGELDHAWQRALERRLDLAAVLPQRRRDPRQAQAFVDLLLGLGDDQVAGLRLEQAVLVQLQPLAHRHLADPDVVRLRAGEVDHRGAPGLERDDAQVDLQPGPCEHGGLRIAARDDSVDDAVAGEGLHDRAGVVRGDEEVDVADRLPHPAQRPGVRRPPHAESIAPSRSSSSSASSRAALTSTRPPDSCTRWTPARMFSSVFFENPFSSVRLPRLRGGDQVLDVVDAELLVELPSPSSDRSRGSPSSRARPAGIFARSSSSSGNVPDFRNSTILSAIDRPTLGIAQDPLLVEVARGRRGGPPTERAAFSYARGLNGSPDTIDSRSANSRSSASTASLARATSLREAEEPTAAAPSACGGGSRPGPTRRSAGRRSPRR